MAIRGFGRPRDDFMFVEREPEFTVPSFNYVAPTINEDAINKALEAVTVRKEANDAINNATDQYEADVADFKNTQATEIEQGIAMLPEILNLSETPFVPEGIGSFTSLPRTEREIGRENELPYQETVIPRMPNENAVPFIPFRRDEQIFVPPPSIQDIDERDFRDTIGRGGREDFVRDFDDTGFGDYIIEDPIIPPMTPPVDLPIDNPYVGIFKPPINIPGIFDDIGYPPFDDIGYPPFDPPITPPDDPPVTDPIAPGIDDIIKAPTGPMNYYTGQRVSNPYTPYSTDSGAAPLTRTISPRNFGRAPGMFPTPTPIIKPPRIPPPRDDIIRVPPPDDIRRLKGGGGISMLPMNGQGDTLTTQVFQSGFRPRR